MLSSCLNPNSPDVSHNTQLQTLLQSTSENSAPLTVLEKLVRSVLHTYNPELPVQHQTFTNQNAESLLQALAENIKSPLMHSILVELVREE